MRLIRRGDIVSAEDLSVSRWERLRRRFIAGIGSVAFTAALGMGMPSIARAAEVTDIGDNVTMEQVENTVEETAPAVEQTPAEESAPVVETAPAVEQAPVEESVPVVETAPAVEQAPVEESAPVVETAPAVEQTTVEESAPVVETAPAVEQTTVEESAPVVETAPATEQTTAEGSTQAEETASAAEQTTAEGSTQAEETASAAEQTTAEGSTQTAEKTESEKQTEESTQTVEKTESEKQTEGSTLVEDNDETKSKSESAGKPTVAYDYNEQSAYQVKQCGDVLYVFTTKKFDINDTEARKMEYQRFEEWRQAHFVSYMPKINLYSISGLEPGEHEFVGVIINLDKDGNVTVLDKNVDKTVKLDDNLESIDTNKAEENDKTSSDEQTKTGDESKTEKEQDKKTETKNVKIKDDDYIIVTGKDGSITIVTKLPLNSAMGLKIKNSLIASGKITDKTIINFMTLKANGETVIGNSTLTVNNEGVLGIIGDDFKDVEALYDSEVASYLNARLNKDENGHLDGNKEKPDHNEPTPEPDKPTPEPDKPTPEPDKPTPEPNKPTPEPNKPVTTPKTEISKKLPQTGDVADPSLAGVLATSGVIALASGVALAKDKKKNGKDDGTFDRWETMTGPDDDINKKYEEIIGHKGKHFSNETKGQIIETEQNHKKRFFR